MHNQENLEILYHIIVLCLFLLSLFWVAIKDSKIIQMKPFKIIAILTIFITIFVGIIGGLALSVFDIVSFFKEL